MLAFGGIDVFEGHFDGTAGCRLVGGTVTSVEVIPGIVANVVRTLGLIDTEEIDGAVLVGEGNADIVAIDRIGPISDAIGVDFAAENAY